MLSIVTINLNNEAGLKKTLDSLQIQESQNFQWVFIDGLSCDSSFQIAEKFRRVSDVLLCEKDSGIYNAMNKALGLVAGDYVIFLNSGDTFFDESAVKSILNNVSSDIDLLTFGFVVRDKHRMPKPAWWRYWSLPTSHQAIIYRTDLLRQFPFNERYRYASDFEQFLRINSESRCIKKVNSILVLNEQYSCDDNLDTVLVEYRNAILQNNLPVLWAWFIYYLKKFYLKIVLR